MVKKLNKNGLRQKNKVADDSELEEKTQQIFHELYETYSYRRITAELYKTHHQKINPKKALRIMNKLGLKLTKFWRKSRRYSSYKGTIAPNPLNRRFSAKYPLQKLIADVTAFKTADEQKLYLRPIMENL
ncbi:IS3 family transposase [Facklamia sp. P12950]|uniref:IS3 family transposase n=1 Tax=Facklamia sp. P12950 TaxID=3421951 RepID=UPI003D17B202